MRVVGVLMSLIGILYFSVIMGFVVDGIRAKMDMLKKGKSNVAEQKHTVRSILMITSGVNCEYSNHHVLFGQL